ncbi:hypothetical protein L873DRAFT_156603 [Choiromyces venosus 120613-1]|uniref:Uncharacterized protein n=1 Tax=Choiromyces venosus 120613-1 TaxID=1336337 RepID=A0A3N4J5R0_9PEZI|nr:hypothetical protein L873DRAFT_156603 [Choiromyces venosus 120613-1]
MLSGVPEVSIERTKPGPKGEDKQSTSNRPASIAGKGIRQSTPHRKKEKENQEKRKRLLYLAKLSYPGPSGVIVQARYTCRCSLLFSFAMSFLWCPMSPISCVQ